MLTIEVKLENETTLSDTGRVSNIIDSHIQRAECGSVCVITILASRRRHNPIF